MKKILVIRFSSVGDIVMTLPVAGALKELYGENCKIVWMTKKVYADLVTSNKFIDEVIYFEDFQDKWFRIIKEIVRNVNKWFNKKTFKNLTVIKNFLYLFPINKKLSNYKFDMVLDLQGSIESSILSMSTRAMIRLIPWHVKNGAERFAKQIIPPDTDNKHEIEKYLDVVRFLSKDKLNKISFGWDFNESDKNLLLDICKKNNIDLKKPYVILPLRTQWQSKNYPLEYWADIIKYFNKVGVIAVVCGTNLDKKYTEKLRDLLDSSYDFVDLCGKTTMKQLVLLINNAKLIISSDSGPMHIAYSLNKKVIALFGPTNPKLVHPIGGAYILQIDKECRCCNKTHCPRDLECLKAIKPELVINIIKRFF